MARYAREWSVMDSSDSMKATRDVGIRLPFISVLWTCDRRRQGGFNCTRAEHHTGRHAATLSDGTLVAVWE